MPKIPTFITESRLTPEVKSISSNIQMNLDQTIGNVLAPVTNTIIDYKIKQKDFENKTEALKLENDFITEMQKVYGEVNILENEDQAQSILKNKSNILIQKYSNLASNKNSQTLFNQYALSEIQKGIVRISDDVQKNTLISLDNKVTQKVEKLMTTAMLKKNGLDYQVLEQDLRDVYTINYQGKISNALLNKIINEIPNTTKTFEADQMISKNPIKALEMLKDEKQFIGLTYESRQDLIKQAQKTLAPIVQDQWESYIEQINDGQDVEPFNLNLISEVFSEETANEMIEKENTYRETADKVKIILNSNEKDVFKVVKEFSDEAKQKHSYKTAKDIEKIYNSILNQRTEDIEKDPVEYIIRTNKEIKNLIQEIENEQDQNIVANLSKELAIKIMETQTNIGIKKSNQKVMTNSMSLKFINEYKQAAKDKNVNLQESMLKGLITSYGNLESAALEQLMIDGLPQGAKFISSGFATEEDKMKFLSLDDPEIVKDLIKNLEDKNDSDISFQKMRSAIRENPEFENMENIIRRNVLFDPSDEIPIVEDIVEFLAKYGTNEFLNGSVNNFDTAAKNAVEMFTKNFQIEDTYYYPKNFIDSTTGKKIVTKKIERNIEMMEVIKNNYISKIDFVSFGSTKENITDKELVEKMQYNLRENGEWRNSPDGQGFVFGIVLNNNTFGIPKDKNGKELFFPLDYDEDTIPGFDIKVNLDIEMLKQQSRQYLGYQEKINQKDFSLGKRPNQMSENEFEKITNINK